jgi:hypothetical protein
MKLLQRNFTTPEQSKRLLELGVPEWTADCFYKLDLYSFKTEMCFTKEDSLLHHYTPCWSVGRLIEIYLICNEVIDNVTELHHSAIKIDVREFNIVEYIIKKLTTKVKKNKGFFSKLEE